MINQPQVMSNLVLLRTLVKQCIDRFTVAMPAVRDLGEAGRATEIMELLAGWEHR